MNAERDENENQEGSVSSRDADPRTIFGLGRSDGSDIARERLRAVQAAVAAHHDSRRR
jgi:hypothetical protein